ncbi:hypothetical protein Thi970DRAFT_01029 [Thiorhodovibrio frisius]|uniref:Uncharacterized protein n=1 Tax=Thiorhodovibrio frisius TaxID=631362 RepID=H8YY43_9GAMM|nr:hypothetical protein Thi970DRAFT_01029 [Thiorhodovibrio frisius]WPL23550.1 hypothetical protein Thiofri_03742 [Thiorhodovibrio frisius]
MIAYCILLGCELVCISCGEENGYRWWCARSLIFRHEQDKVAKACREAVEAILGVKNGND